MRIESSNYIRTKIAVASSFFAASLPRIAVPGARVLFGHPVTRPALFADELVSQFPKPKLDPVHEVSPTFGS